VDALTSCLKDIERGIPTTVANYDFKTNSKISGSFRKIDPSDVVLVEGILLFYYKKVRDIFAMKLFVDTDADTRLSRRGDLIWF
jgi:uridine kinase